MDLFITENETVIFADCFLRRLTLVRKKDELLQKLHGVALTSQLHGRKQTRQDHDLSRLHPPTNIPTHQLLLTNITLKMKYSSSVTDSLR
jgi:hypothetical protein